MFCKYCGKKLEDNETICSECGNPVEQKKDVRLDDYPSFGYGFLGFLIPLVGLILYLVWKNDYPLKSKSAGKGALISVIIYIAFYLIYFVFSATAIGCSIINM